MSDCTKCKYVEWDCYDISEVGKTKVLCGCKNDLILPQKDCQYYEEKIRKDSVKMINKDIYMKIKEVYINLKNYDFDTFGNYKMDVNEAKKFMEAFEKLEVKE